MPVSFFVFLPFVVALANIVPGGCISRIQLNGSFCHVVGKTIRVRVHETVTQEEKGQVIVKLIVELLGEKSRSLDVVFFLYFLLCFFYESNRSPIRVFDPTR